MVPATVMTMEATVVTVESAVVTVEAAAVTATTARTRTETCRRHAHTCDCGNRRNENFTDLHVFTSFFLEPNTGVGNFPSPV
jgi:hypothetical protein